MAADPVSSLFPNRPIRPLPKRRLRERLSPELADSIQYPLPQSSAPLFQYPYPLAPEQHASVPAPTRETASYSDRKLQTNGMGNGGEHDGGALRHGVASRTAPQYTNLVTRSKPEHGRYADSLPLPQTVSSADGYDLFENTNNKKRKIPSAGDSAPTGFQAVNDAAPGGGSVGISAQSADAHGEPLISTSNPYYGPGNFVSGVHNIPGPGRGRYGRPKSGKNTHRSSFDPNIGWAARPSRPRSGQWAAGTSESTGIITNAIANAEKLPPPEGKDSISLLQQSSAKRSPDSTQFTFTCGSQVPGSVAWPEPDRRVALPIHPSGAASQSKEQWSRASQATQNGQSPQTLPRAGDGGVRDGASRGHVNGQTQQPAPPQKSSRRSAAKEYEAAARARRRETQLYNKRHPPNPDEMWICHFCEYEAIFGGPPVALVRQYEIKERKQRQLEEQRRAQWERMKKGKHKGKKGNKLPAKNNNAAHGAHHHADNHGAPGDHYDHDGQGEEYYDDEYYEDEEYDPDEEVAIEHDPPGHGCPDEFHRRRFGGTPGVHDGGGT
ncbi:hypothetical protein N0V88_003645 [Collariella sp. IMI 366227]|nr:hypothetical protein N0V88_003645 [Collariella sp. IMI 366227]